MNSWALGTKPKVFCHDLKCLSRYPQSLAMRVRPLAVASSSKGTLFDLRRRYRHPSRQYYSSRFSMYYLPCSAASVAAKSDFFKCTPLHLDLYPPPSARPQAQPSLVQHRSHALLHFQKSSHQIRPRSCGWT